MTVLLAAAVLGLILWGHFCTRTERNDTAVVSAEAYLPSELWNPVIVEECNTRGITVEVDGSSLAGPQYPVYMSDERTVMVSVRAAEAMFRCAAFFDSPDEFTIEKNEIRLTGSLADKTIYSGQTAVADGLESEEKDGHVCISAESLAKGMDYTYVWNGEENKLELTEQKPEEDVLPSFYDYRQEGRAGVVKDQGASGTCWADATTTALETSLLPLETTEFAPDHVSLRNSFHVSPEDGGNYMMSMAYLTSWEGPVTEEEDPYGDGYSPEGLSAVKHVQEIRIIDSGDRDGIKEAVYRYGGVESALYFDLMNQYSSSAYYSRANNAYCYSGSEEANHDIVIIGWDDDFPSSAFPVTVPGNGAFICQNSWGTSFGDNGVFYVSYYDTVLGTDNIVYSLTENTDNYTNIYQSDRCGWIGQMGFDREEAEFANVYTASGHEEVKAAGFYATKAGTQYEVSIVPEFTDTDSFDSMELAAEGTFDNAGYYTVPFNRPREISAGSRFAVVVRIVSPGSLQPVAIEYQADEISSAVDISDGEGYLSYDGSVWLQTETSQNCNVCLKAYTDPYLSEE